MTTSTYLIRDDGWRLVLHTQAGEVARAEVVGHNGAWRCMPRKGVGHLVASHDAALTWLRDLVAAVPA